jgi:hypothetical protein
LSNNITRNSVKIPFGAEDNNEPFSNSFAPPFGSIEAEEPSRRNTHREYESARDIGNSTNLTPPPIEILRRSSHEEHSDEVSTPDISKNWEYVPYGSEEDFEGNDFMDMQETLL